MTVSINTATRAREIFLSALELHSAQERWEFLDSACSGDASLRQKVERLLEAHGQLDDFMAQPAAGMPAVIPEPVAEALGSKIGPYTLRELLGEGGMGSVYVAEQEAPILRKVALKVIKPGMDTRDVIARFEAERQALALMDHPHIAKVLDAGATDAGRPYFVMELVRGIPITDYLDEANASLRERLELFVQVCQAVQHAHQKGIIHRDLKPNNVLVAQHDGVPTPKVIDFGIAKAINPRLTEHAVYTQVAQIVGTPVYMSPEQAQLNAVDVDTRSDVYSLGVLLYELLTGATPFDKDTFSKVGYDEMRRIIREDVPPRPSQRGSTLAAKALPTVSQKRVADNRQCIGALRGELDWIVMKALEKDRRRRYDTPAALAVDIQHYLNDEPVVACPPSAWYRFHKFARRNKSALATASVVGLAGLVALATLTVSTFLIAREQQATKRALQAETRAKDDQRREAYFQRITVAHRELSIDNLAAAVRALAECPEDLRGWEWYYLMRLCKLEPQILRDDSAEFSGLAFSPDGERFVSAGSDGKIKSWDSRTLRMSKEFLAHKGKAQSVAYHPNGRYLASTGEDRLVKVWNLETGQEVFQRPCDAIRPFGAAYTVAFSPDGRLLAAGSDGAVMVWDWKKNQPRPERTFPVREVHSIPVAFSRDGRLATGSRRDGQQIWDTERGGLTVPAFPAHRHPVSALAFSPDGGRLASASFDSSVNVWNTMTGELLHTLLHSGNVDCVAFSSDGQRLVSAGEDKTVRIWDVATGREVLSLRGHAGRCGCVAFSPDGLRLASASTDGTIRVWDARRLEGNEGQEFRTFNEHSDAIYTVAISPDGQKIASAGYDPLKVWDARTGEVSLGFRGRTAVVFGVAWHPDGELIASADSEGQHHSVRIWNARTERVAFIIPAGRGPVALPYFAVAFSTDGRYLVTGNGNGAVQVWDARSDQGGRVLGIHQREVRGLVFSPDGQFLASSSDREVNLWDAMRLDKEQKPRLPPLPARVPGTGLNLAFSPDSRRLATGGEKNTVIIWDAQTGGRIQTLWGEHSGEVYALAFSPLDDGRLIASAGEDTSVKVWDSHTGKLIRSFRGHIGFVSSLAFSPDGRCLVSGSRDSMVKVWDVSELSDSNSTRQHTTAW